MPPNTPSRALVVLSAIFSPSVTDTWATNPASESNPALRAALLTDSAIIRRWHAGNGRLPHFDAGPRSGDGAHSGPTGNSEAIPFLVSGDGDTDFRPVSGVRVVAAVLDYRT